MVNIGYIREFDDEKEYMEQANEDYAFMESKLDEIIYYEERIADMEFFGESGEELELMTEGVSEALKVIGDKIISILQRISQMFTAGINKIKEAFGGKKDNLETLKAEIHKDPKKASMKIHDLVSSGKMSVDDFKSLSGYYKEVDNVLKQLEKDNVDPESLKGRIIKAEEKITKGAKVAVAVAGGLVTINKCIQMFQKKSAENETNMEKAKKLYEDESYKLSQRLGGMKKVENAGNTDSFRRKATVYSAAAASMEKVSRGYVSAGTKTQLNLNKMLDKALSIVGKGDKDAFKHAQSETKARKRSLDVEAHNVNQKIKQSREAVTPSNNRNSSRNGKGGKP